MSIQPHASASRPALRPVVYTSARPFGSLMDLRRTAAFLELYRTFVERDLRVRYKQTLLGATWAVLPPVMLMIVFSIFLGRFAKLPSEGVPYPIFAYAALLPWTFFSSVLSSATTSISSNSAIISKVAFPRELLPWAAIAGAGVDFLVGVVVFGALLAFYGVHVTWALVLVVPLLVLQVLFMAGLALLFAAFNAYFRDVRYAIPLLLQIWMFATPVVYSTTSVPERLRLLYLTANPMAALIDAYRGVLLHGRVPDLRLMAVVAAVALCVFVVCYAVFKRVEPEFADIA
jgi:lipopolysaccharide transport system permease protein